MTYYLAIDIGASSGRHILAHMEDGKLCLEEIHRFENGMKEKNGHLCWDTEHLFHEVKEGLKKCMARGTVPKTVGIDTWGIDFVLLGDDDDLIGDAVGYRDSRTNGMDNLVNRTIPAETLYRRTGIQKAIFNTVYQLMAVKEETPEYLEQAKTMLFMPDYLNFLLTGKKAAEYTIASTSQLLDPVAKDWDADLFQLLGLPTHYLQPIVPAGNKLGCFTDEIAEELGFSSNVINVAEHDTGSAVAALPTAEDTVYISSGTWSLMGIERESVDISDAARAGNFTNEGGYEYRFRFLKNIMGLWMIQSVRNELCAQGEMYGFGELCDLASVSHIESVVRCNDGRFLAPASMICEIREACRESGQQVPETAGELAKVVYASLAKCYSETIGEIEAIAGKTYDHINIVGGGANASYLNELTAKATGKTVYAGPTEATAIGNLLVQMIGDGVFGNLDEARKCVFESFGIKTFPA
ncbi:MAG: rhamnulokinase [Lachnospiraceae bacterium]|nr:rhamnulokinase [Lachnospiraceae bacterium]